jgi:hypothetical protein
MASSTSVPRNRSYHRIPSMSRQAGGGYTVIGCVPWKPYISRNGVSSPVVAVGLYDIPFSDDNLDGEAPIGSGSADLGPWSPRRSTRPIRSIRVQQSTQQDAINRSWLRAQAADRVPIRTQNE